jgi:hypothetical protein
MERSNNKFDWIDKAKKHKLGNVLALVFDGLRPLGPLGAQLLWVLQPTASLFGWHKTIGELAETLEEPDGIEQLQQRLHEETTEH